MFVTIKAVIGCQGLASRCIDFQEEFNHKHCIDAFRLENSFVCLHANCLSVVGICKPESREAI